VPHQRADSLPRERSEVERRTPRIRWPLHLHEPLAQEREQIGRRSGSDDREQRAARVEPAGVESERVLPLEGFHVAPEPVRRMSVGMLRAVPERHDGSCRDAARLVEIALQRRKRPPPRRGDLLLRERRLQRDLQQRVQRLPRQIGGDGERQGRLVERYLDAEARSHALDQLVDAARVAPHRSATQEIRRELRQPRLPARILRRSSRHAEAHVKQGHRPSLDGDELQA
jgi:hypothetical protein